jgi:outer membrane protein assembly factor BamB
MKTWWKADLRLPKGAVRAWRRASAPFVVDDVCVVGGLDWVYTAHDINNKGAPRWSFTGSSNDSRGALLNPLMHEGALIVEAPDGIAHLDLTTGAELKRTRLSSGVAAVTSHAGGLIIATEDAQLSTDTWKIALPAAPSAIVVDNDTAFMCCNGFTLAIDLASGAERWRKETGRVGASTVCVRNDVVLVPTGERGTLLALDAKDGGERWKYDARECVFGTPTTSGALAFCTAMYGRTPGNTLHAVDVATGAQRFVVVGEFGQGLGVCTSGDAVIAALGSHVVVVDTSTGDVRDKFEGTQAIAHAPVMQNGIVFVTTSHALYAIKRAVGRSDGTSPSTT